MSSQASENKTSAPQPLLSEEHDIEAEVRRLKNPEPHRGPVQTTAGVEAKVTQWGCLVDPKVGPAHKKRSKWDIVRGVVRRSAVPAQEVNVVTEDTLDIACMYLNDATHGRAIGYSVAPASRRIYKLFHARWWVNSYLVVALLHMTLILFEPPTVKPDLWYPGLVTAIELLFLAVYVLDVALLYTFFSKGYKKTNFWKHRWSLVRIAVVVATLVDLIVNISSDYTTFRYTRLLRPIMIIARLRNVRTSFLGTIVTLRRIGPMFLLIGINIMFFALVGSIIFHTFTSAQYFTTLPGAFYWLWRIQTQGGINLEIMGAYWDESPWTALFFTSFVIFGNMVLFRLFFATAVRSYKTFTKRKTMSRIRKRRRALNEAFHLLATPSKHHTDETAVNRATWHRVMNVLRPKLKADVIDVMFAAIDVADKDEVLPRQFMNLCSLINVKFRVHPDILGWPKLNSWRRFGRVVFNHSFYVGSERIVVMDLVEIFFVLVAAMQMYVEAWMGQQNPVPQEVHVWRSIAVVALIFFWLDSIAKCVCFGRARFFDNLLNVMDVVCNVCGALYFILLGKSMNVASPLQTVINMALILRLFRILRLMYIVASTKKVMLTLQRVSPPLIRVIFIVFSIFYMYGMIGMGLYGNRQLSEVRLTFGDFYLSMLTMFEVGILGRWPDNMMAVGIWPAPWMEVYFFSFRIFTAMLLMPVFIGFMIESFVNNYSFVERDYLTEEQNVKDRRNKWKAERDAARKHRRLAHHKLPESDSHPSEKQYDPEGHATITMEMTGEGTAEDSHEAFDKQGKAFNFVEEAPVEIGLRRRNSEVNYITFDVATALRAQDYFKMEHEFEDQKKQLARKTERIRILASKLLEQQTEIRHLQAHVHSLQDLALRNPVIKAANRFMNLASEAKESGGQFRDAGAGSRNILSAVAVATAQEEANVPIQHEPVDTRGIESPPKRRAITELDAGILQVDIGDGSDSDSHGSEV